MLEKARAATARRRRICKHRGGLEVDEPAVDLELLPPLPRALKRPNRSANRSVRENRLDGEVRERCQLQCARAKPGTRIQKSSHAGVKFCRLERLLGVRVVGLRSVKRQ